MDKSNDDKKQPPFNDKKINIFRSPKLNPFRFQYDNKGGQEIIKLLLIQKWNLTTDLSSKKRKFIELTKQKNNYEDHINQLDRKIISCNLLNTIISEREVLVQLLKNSINSIEEDSKQLRKIVKGIGIEVLGLKIEISDIKAQLNFTSTTQAKQLPNIKETRNINEIIKELTITRLDLKFKNAEIKGLRKKQLRLEKVKVCDCEISKGLDVIMENIHEHDSFEIHEHYNDYLHTNKSNNDNGSMIFITKINALQNICDQLRESYDNLSILNYEMEMKRNGIVDEINDQDVLLEFVTVSKDDLINKGKTNEKRIISNKPLDIACTRCNTSRISKEGITDMVFQLNEDWAKPSTSSGRVPKKDHF